MLVVTAFIEVTATLVHRQEINRQRRKPRGLTTDATCGRGCMHHSHRCIREQATKTSAVYAMYLKFTRLPQAAYRCSTSTAP